MPNWIKYHPQGTLLNVYVQPGASLSVISGVHGDRLKIKIKSPARDGEANLALIEFLSEFMGLARSRIQIIRGESSRQKDLWLELSIKEVALKLKGLS